MNKHIHALDENLKISEGISGVYFYHLSTAKHSERSLCGRRTMPTSIPIKAWGHYNGHLKERYCAECEKLGGLK
jgi:hypothetical protein